MTKTVYWQACRDGALIPRQAKLGDVGFDLATAVDAWIWPGQTLAIPTGLKVVLPAEIELQIRPRSGLSLRTHLRIPNSPGTIDPGYRDEIRVLIHHSAYGWENDLDKDAELQELIAESFSGNADTAFDPEYIARCAAAVKRLGLKPHRYDLLERGWAPYHIKQGDRIAQAVPQLITLVEWQELDRTSIDEAEANSVPDREGGFASSGYGSGESR